MMLAAPDVMISQIGPPPLVSNNKNLLQQEEISAFDERRLAPNPNQHEPSHPVTPKLLSGHEDRCRPLSDLIFSRHSDNEELATSIQIGDSAP